MARQKPEAPAPRTTALKVRDLRACIDALSLIAGYPLSIDFAWKSARVRKQLEQEMATADEVLKGLFGRFANHETADGQKAIRGPKEIEAHRAETEKVMDREIGVDLGLTEAQLRKYLEEKPDREHAATIIHGLLPILIADDG